MKTLRILSTFLLMSVLMTACGGGKSGSDPIASTNPETKSTPAPSTTTPAPSVTPTPSTTPESNDLIIDNGRGTSNNQDTERPK